MSADISTSSEKERKHSFVYKNSFLKLCGIPIFLQFIGFLYTMVIVFYLLHHSEGAYGQEIPLYIRATYIKPFAYFYIIVFAPMAMIPFAILRFIGTPRHTYPASKITSDNSVFPTIFLTLANGYNGMNSIYAIMGPIYYFYDYCFRADSTGSLETVLVFVYPIAYILGLGFWLGSISEFVGCFLNMINMWKFTILQLSSDPIEIV